MASKDQDAVMRKNGFISCAEVSEKTKHDVATIYRWIDDGKVVGSRLGRRRFVDVRSLVKHLGFDTAVMFGVVTKEQASQLKALDAKSASK